MEGREIPDCAAGGQSPQTLKSARRSLNGDVAFSAQGWVKLAIVLEAYRTLSDTMTAQTAQQLTSMITEGSTTTTNEVLRQIGSGDPQAGANQPLPWPEAVQCIRCGPVGD